MSKNINYDKSIKLLNIAYITILISFFVISISSFVYVKYTSDNYLDKKAVVSLTVTEGKEKGKRILLINRPLVKVENIKDWLSVSFIDMFSYDANNYGSQERLDLFKRIFSEKTYASHWNSEIARIEEEINNGYMITSALITDGPYLEKQARSSDGSRLWRFYLEISLWSRSNQTASFLDRTKKIKVLVKEVDPKQNFKGLSIVKIDIK